MPLKFVTKVFTTTESRGWVSIAQPESGYILVGAYNGDGNASQQLIKNVFMQNNQAVISFDGELQAAIRINTIWAKF